MTWTAHVTVAAIIERDGKFLFVDELIEGRQVINQPAGHLEPGESLLEAVCREVREETAWRFVPEFIIGTYRMHVQGTGITYLRICFSGACTDHQPLQPLDKGITATLWLGYDEVASRRDSLRSPLVMRCLDDYIQGDRYSLDSLKDLGNVQS